MLNRANARMPIFTKYKDFIAFETVLEEAVARTRTRLSSHFLMHNHWHAHRESTGSLHLCQERFKTLPVQDDNHFQMVSRSVERNALRPNLLKRAEDCRWNSLYRWYSETTEEKALLSAWPLRRSARWLENVNSASD